MKNVEVTFEMYERGHSCINHVCEFEDPWVEGTNSDLQGGQRMRLTCTVASKIWILLHQFQVCDEITCDEI